MCVDSSRANATVQAVGSAGDCHAPDSPFSEVFDLLGNVSEWQDSCDLYGSTTDSCLVTGDNYNVAPPLSACADSSFLVRRDSSYPATGFRCCAD
jgi:hypothetical protein